MRFIADLHIHSRYSRACSRDLTPENLQRWGELKGIRVIGTGDITHPLWLGELREKLEPSEGSLLTLKKGLRTDDVPDSCRADVSFLLSGEISCIFKRGGKTRKVHALVFLPDFAAVERLRSALGRLGNLASDGRPILGLDVKQLLQMVLDASSEATLVPAHAWTPHFSLFGASSGFDSLEDCFEELTPHIHAIETGLSSDPSMNWRLSHLDRITLISNSDAHSPAKLGREANIFATDITYQAIMEGIRTKKGFMGTIEFFPEEGKYHHDGHRTCGARLAPRETIGHDNLCPSCGKRVTIGVLHRIEALADAPDGRRPECAPPFYSVIPLAEIIGKVLKVGVSSKKVQQCYFDLLGKLGNEFTILLETPVEDIARAGFPHLGEAIRRIRAGKIRISPGFDGQFGEIEID